MTQFPTDESTSKDFAVATEPPKWPKVIGIISIVVSSLSLVCGGCGLVQNAMSFAQGGKDTQMPNGQTVHFPAPSALAVGLGAVGWLWAVLLLVAGIMVLRRKAMGRPLHLLYAAVSILLTIASVAVGMGDMQRVMEAMKQNAQMAQMVGMIQMFAYGVMCFAVVLGLGYPIFLLIWFGPLGKKPEVGAAPEEPLV